MAQSGQGAPQQIAARKAFVFNTSLINNGEVK